MSATLEADPLTPTQRRSSIRLGLGLAALCLALLVACIIIFTRYGLPKDPKAWKRLQQRAAAASTPADVPAAVPANEEQPR
jgi:hypothetical protein